MDQKLKKNLKKYLPESFIKPSGKSLRYLKWNLHLIRNYALVLSRNPVYRVNPQKITLTADYDCNDHSHDEYLNHYPKLKSTGISNGKWDKQALKIEDSLRHQSLQKLFNLKIPSKIKMGRLTSLYSVYL